MEINDKKIKEIISQALKEYKEGEKKSKKRGVLRNTKLLMRNYKSLKDHYENAKDNINDVAKDIIEFKDIDDFELYIKSIMRSKARTLIMITHIDSALQVLKNKMNKNNELYKFKVIKSIYIDEEPLTFEQIASKYNCNVRTVRRWYNEMIRELSILLFGIDALDEIA